jgi:hypothetical protein
VQHEAKVSGWSGSARNLQECATRGYGSEGKQHPIDRDSGNGLSLQQMKLGRAPLSPV